jgi:hypothetical protein
MMERSAAEEKNRFLWNHLRMVRMSPMTRDTAFAGLARKPLMLGFVGGGIMGVLVGAGDTLAKIGELRKTHTASEIARLTGKNALKTGAICTGYVFPSPHPSRATPTTSPPPSCRFFGAYHLIASQLSSWDLVEPASYSGAGIAAAVAISPFIIKASWRQHVPICMLMVAMDVFDRYRTQERVAASATRTA